MSRWCAGLGVLLSCLIAAGFSVAQDNQPARPLRGAMPRYFKQLGLTDQQRQQVLATQAKYRTKIDDLREQMRKLQREERTELTKLLTPAQKQRLREIIAERAPADSSSGTDAAPTKKKTRSNDKK